MLYLPSSLAAHIMFYGARVKPGAKVALTPEEGEVLHLSGACLHKPSNDERTYLVLHQNGQDHIICALKKGTAENVSLDLFVATREGGHFEVQGASEMHLTGYYEPTASDSENDEDDEEMASDLEGMSDEEALERLMAAKNKKKAALISAEAEEDSDEEGDEDDDEDDEDNDEEGNQAGDSDEEDDSDDEEEIRRTIQKEMQKVKAEKAEKKKAATTPALPVPAPSSDKKRKAAEPIQAGKPGKQRTSCVPPQGRLCTEKSGNSPSSNATAQFEKSVSEYLKQHGKCMISQVASACPKPASVTSKYREFLVSRPVFTVEGQHVSLKN